MYDDDAPGVTDKKAASDDRRVARDTGAGKRRDLAQQCQQTTGAAADFSPEKE